MFFLIIKYSGLVLCAYHYQVQQYTYAFQQISFHKNKKYEMSIKKLHHYILTKMIKFFMRIPEGEEIFIYFIFRKIKILNR